LSYSFSGKTPSKIIKNSLTRGFLFEQRSIINYFEKYSPFCVRILDIGAVASRTRVSNKKKTSIKDN